MSWRGLLLDAYWESSSDLYEEPIDRPIVFKKGDYEYSVKHGSRTALSVTGRKKYYQFY
jgi:hypothetical protein